MGSRNEINQVAMGMAFHRAANAHNQPDAYWAGLNHSMMNGDYMTVSFEKLGEMRVPNPPLTAHHAIEFWGSLNERMRVAFGHQHGLVVSKDDDASMQIHVALTPLFVQRSRTVLEVGYLTHAEKMGYKPHKGSNAIIQGHYDASMAACDLIEYMTHKALYTIYSADAKVSQKNLTNIATTLAQRLANTPFDLTAQYLECWRKNGRAYDKAQCNTAVTVKDFRWGSRDKLIIIFTDGKHTYECPAVMFVPRHDSFAYHPYLRAVADAFWQEVAGTSLHALTTHAMKHNMVPHCNMSDAIVASSDETTVALTPEERIMEIRKQVPYFAKWG